MRPACLTLALLLLAACDTMPATTCDVDAAPELVDLNGDGKPEIRKFIIKGREVCRETDLDFDGKPDTILMSDAGRGVSWLGSDLDRDGRCDQVEVRVDGKPTHLVLDTNGDGRPDERRPL